jgi:TATA-box binding protein (TBP) (component of TFIID and TFIIIB)
MFTDLIDLEFRYGNCYCTDAKNADQVKELALKIGEVLRACNVKRGIGTIGKILILASKDIHEVRSRDFRSRDFL